MRRLFSIAWACLAGCSFQIDIAASGDDEPPPDDGGVIDEAQVPWLAGWAYRKPITLRAAQIETGPAPLVDFPIMISLADPDIVTRARPDRTDVVFTAGDATTRLAHEIEMFDQVSLTAWVRMPSLAAVDTTIYVYYGNATPPAPPSGTDVWTASYAAVYHLQQDPGPGLADQILDATANARHGTAGSLTSADSKPSLFGRAIEFNGSNSYITVAPFDVGPAFTISMWMYMSNVNQIRALISNSPDGGSSNGFRFFVNSNGSGDRKIVFETGNGQNTDPARTPNNAAVSSRWQHVAAVVDRTAGTATIVVDGAVANTADLSIRNDFATNQKFEIGRMQTNNPFDGMLDQVEIAATMRSLEWLRTSFKNQGAPADFYVVGPEEAH